MKNRYYNMKKSEIRLEAIFWQIQASGYNYSYGELLEKQIYFEKMGKKYGLIREFRENGIL